MFFLLSDIIDYYLFLDVLLVLFSYPILLNSSTSSFPRITSVTLLTSILATLDWPIVLAFETKAAPADPNSVIDEAIKKRTKLLHMIYPPTLTTLPPAKVVVAEWTPDMLPNTGILPPSFLCSSQVVLLRIFC